MKRVLSVGFAILLLVTSLSVGIAAQDQGNSPIQACVALGVSPAVCATCVVAGITHGGADYGPCFCKYDATLLAQFKNFGECVVYVQKNIRP
jgi:hypothetical protein